MRLLIHVIACLTFCGISNAYANTIITASKDTDKGKTIVKEESKKEKAIIEVIPNMTLDIKVEKANLRVNLKGNSEKLDWIIFQPKGKVISRLTTTSKITEIKTDNLEKGKYVLMVKDASGRTLFRAFDKV